jgi:arsenite methyltransferase
MNSWKVRRSRRDSIGTALFAAVALRNAVSHRFLQVFFKTGEEHVVTVETMTEQLNITMTEQLNIDELRDEIRTKYAAVVATPSAEFHFHTGRALTKRLGYDQEPIDSLPEIAVESFAGVANPFEQRSIQPGEKIVDLGSGAGLDSFLAAMTAGPDGRVIGVDMTEDMLRKSTAVAEQIGLDNVEFVEGYLEELPVEDGWADVVIANGVINLCPDKERAFAEAFRVLRPGGVLQFADIANNRPVPEEARRQIDLWTG